MNHRRTSIFSGLLAVLIFLVTLPAFGFPGFFVGKKEAKRVNHSTHVVLMMQADRTVVSVLPDYDGPLEPFALVLAVPGDVTLDRVKTLRRDFVDRLDQMSAPRFHEFWEKDPCESGAAQQEWERSRKASNQTAFLGGGTVGTQGKVAKELMMKVEPEFKDGEYTFSLLSDEESLKIDTWLKQKGYQISGSALEAAQGYARSGMKFLVAEVDHNRVELVGSDRAQLSPIRYWSETSVTTVPSRLGLTNLHEMQELFIYVLHPKQRFEVKNYKNAYPPTNIEVDFKVKERVGEFYAALHDKMLSKQPQTFLVEYAWSTQGCGEPCPNPPVSIHELLSLGADVFELTVSDEEKNPKPPEMTEEEEAKFKALDRKEKKAKEEEREEIARRKALVDRHHYVLTRLHHRYNRDTLPQDVQVAPAPGAEGGAALPEGPKGEASTEVKAKEKSRLQTRYNHFHPWKGVLKCESPERWRWGKAPRTYRGLRKVWVVENLAFKDRKEIKLPEVVKTAIPALELAGEVTSAPAAEGGSEAGASADDQSGEKNCGCRVPGGDSSPSRSGLLVWFCLGALLLTRRGGRRKSS